MSKITGRWLADDITLPSAANATTATSGDSSTLLATTEFVSGAVTEAINGMASVMTFKGGVDASNPGTTLDNAAVGDYFKVTTDGNLYGGTLPVKAGDAIFATEANPTDASGWMVIDNTDEDQQDSSAVFLAAGYDRTGKSDAVTNGDTVQQALEKLDYQSSLVAGSITSAIAPVSARIDVVDTELDNLDAVLGVSNSDTDLGVFAGNVISPNASVKSALQEVETYIEARENTVEELTFVASQAGYTLPSSPRGDVILTPVGGVQQVEGTDFSVVGTTLTLTGDLYASLEAGDKILVSYAV